MRSDTRPLDTLADFWWRRLPTSAIWRASRLRFLLVDGVYLLGWPPAGAIVPAAAVVLGIVGGWWPLGPGDSYTWSIALMTLMLVLASLGSAIGGLLVAGYVLGDVLLGGHFGARMPSGDIVRVTLALLLSYLLLALLLVRIPLTSRSLAKQGVAWLSSASRLRIIVFGLLCASVQAGLTWTWGHSVPTLIRPLYTWRGRSPPVEAIQPLQEHGLILVVAASLAALVRIGLERRTSTDVVVLRALQRVRASRPRATHAPRPWPVGIRVGFEAALMTFLLSGLIESWLVAGVVAILLAGMLLGRHQWPASLATVDRVLLRVPLIVRQGATLGVSYLVSRLIVTVSWTRTGTFQPVLAAVLISVLIFVIVTPEARARQAHARPPTGDA